MLPRVSDINSNMVVYKVTNKINGKVYIGQTIHTLEYRRSGHERSALCKKKITVKFHNALLKYGFENFKWEILKDCNSQEELDYFEDYYIKEFDTLDREKGYNLKSGGKTGVKYTEEIKHKIGKSSLNKWKDEECANKMREGLRKGTETVIKKASENFVDFECQYCHKIIKLKLWQTKDRKYCSNECAVKAKADNCIKALKLATEKNFINSAINKENRLFLIKEWLKDNYKVIINCKMNNLKFLNNLCSYIGVKDARSLAKVLDVSNRKDTIYKLKELIKIYAEPADD